MNWVDFLIVGILAVSVIVSLFRGFVREALSLLSWVAAFWVGLVFASRLAELLPGAITSAYLRLGVAFGILFILTLVLGALFNNFVARLVQRTGLSGTDRALGAFFGVFRGVAMVVVLILFAGMTALPQDAWWHHSLFLHYFQDLAIWVRGLLPAHLAQQISFA
ncbi:CvpA family protein [Acidihalobacter ferrooxydans]|uniref:Colicin V production CvpA n=1 Tax=Acidihalobacter ferrooxydans TaxID=1765967 RepID=A0A1P8UGP7_9GAMM|nr:CvpA family protein [Acidihalobacter ferrooxydans]APZ42951.1 colicin V production CvpA [Acidihalobacter ferrooxydans]